MRRRIPRTDSASVAGVVLLESEIVYLTDLDEMRLGDGVTAGGVRLVDIAQVTELVAPYTEQAVEAAEQAQDIFDQVDDLQFDGPALAAALQKASSLGRVTLDEALPLYTKGKFFDFTNQFFVIAGRNKADPNRFTELTATRASEALGLTASRKYQTFPANVWRQTSAGAIIENASVNRTVTPVGTGSGITYGGASAGPSALLAPVEPVQSVTTAIDVVETAAAGGHAESETISAGVLAAGVYTVSRILARRDRRYTLILVSGGGIAGVVGYAIDWDAVGGPTFTIASGAVAATSVAPPQALGNGFYRFALTVTTLSTAVLFVGVNGSVDATYAGRSYTGTAGTKMFALWHRQIENSPVATSPIIAPGGARSADAVLLQTAGGPGDIFIVEYLVGSVKMTALVLRSALSNINQFNLNSDGGAPWASRQIIGIYELPMLDPAYRSLSQRTDDRMTALLATAVLPLQRRIDQITAATGVAPWEPVLPASLDASPQTENGRAPYLVCRPVANADGPVRFMWNGEVFGTEAAMLAAAGGSGSLGTMVLSQGWTGTSNLLGDVNFGVSTSGFSIVNANASVDVTAGELRMTATAGPATFSRNFKGYSGKAFRFSITGRKGTTTAALQAGFTSQNSSFGAGAFSGIISTTANTNVSVIGSIAAGGDWWVGGSQPGNTAGTSFWLAPTLYEVRPARGFPNGNLTVDLPSVVAPASLPASTQTIFQGDAETERDRFRLEWRTDGSLHLIVTANGVLLADLDLGVMAAGSTARIAAAMNRTAVRGVVNGAAGAEVDYVGAPGFSSFRLGRSFTGEAFGGTMPGGYAIFAGAEELPALRRRTAAVRVNPLEMWMEGDSGAAASSTGDARMFSDLGYDVIATAIGGSTFSDIFARFQANVAKYGTRTFTLEDMSENGHTPGQTDIEFDMYVQIVAALAALGNNRHLYVRSGLIGGGISMRASITGNQMTVTSNLAGVIQAGMTVVVPGVAEYVIQTAAAGGGVGVYTLTTSASAPIASTAMYGGVVTTSRGVTSQDMDTLYSRIRGAYGAVHVYDPFPLLKSLAIASNNVPGYTLDQSDIAYGYAPRSIYDDGVHRKVPVRRLLALDRRKALEPLMRL